MKVISADFVTSAAAGGSTAGIPTDGLPQIAVAGRSNVGKSSLLNALCRRKIARTSAAPGKTRLANVFRLTLEGGGPGHWGLYLVDLPGYGYARGGANSAAELAAVAEAYFRAAQAGRDPGRAGGNEAPGTGDGTAASARLKPRAAGRGAVAALLLVDSRHPGLDADIMAAQWLDSRDVVYRVAATKIDKLSRSERARNLKALEITVGMPPVPVSAVSGEGLDTLWKTIASLVRTGRA